MKYVLSFVVAFSFAFTVAAVAQHGHGEKGPNGGPIQDVAGVHAELLTSGNAITIYVVDESMKGVATEGYTASALVVRGSEREVVALAPTPPNILKGSAKKGVGGSAVTVTLKTAAGKTGQAKFRP